MTGEVPEKVAPGCVDDRGLVVIPDLEIVAVGVVVDQDRGDRLRPGVFPGLDAGGEDLVACLELADGDRGPRSEQDLSAGGETRAAARSCISFVSRPGSLLCGLGSECTEVGCFGGVGEGVDAELCDVDDGEAESGDSFPGFDQAFLMNTDFVANIVRCGAQEAEDPAVTGGLWASVWACGRARAVAVAAGGSAGRCRPGGGIGRRC